ncbi:hypothetical protein [Ensifer sp. ZNC0028]|nr:hypothetical protein [Ensifer sp. ZNC0028]
MFRLLPREISHKIATLNGIKPPSGISAAVAATTTRFVKVLERRNGENHIASSAGSGNPSTTRSGGIGGVLRSFLFVVLIPTAAVLFYYISLASNVYVTEVKLTVRKSQEASSGEASSSLASSFLKKLDLGSSLSSGQDTQIISDYLKSRIVIEDLGGKPIVSEYFSRGDIDWFSRLGTGADKEEIWEYWREHITVSIDTVSNILTMRVRAYSNDDTYNLALKLVENSEKLINRISDRTKNDALLRARQEVTRSASDLAGVRTALLNFQQKSGSIDPVMTVKQMTSAVTELSLKKIQLQAQIDVGSLSGLNERPGDKYLETKIKVIDDQIQQFSEKLTGMSSDTLSSQLKDYQLLKLQEEFSEKIYMLARSDYEQARRRIIAQQLYVVVVVPPLLPESALLPRPVLDTFVVFLGLLVVWGIGCLLFASIKDSRI